MNPAATRLRLARAVALGALLPLASMFADAAQADRSDTIEHAKASVVAVGTFVRTRTPPFQFLGTGFAVGDGTIIVTNAHVLPALLDPTAMEALAILVPMPGKDQVQIREAKQLAVDKDSDLALLRIASPGLPAMKIRDSAGIKIKEGQEVLFTGYPIGGVLGPFAATHRGMISAITPIAIPQGRAGDLDAALIRRLAGAAFPVYQLDATAYPGNSGSPVYDPESGEVLGVINMVFVKGTKESALTQPSGITYAVPASHLQDLLKRAR